MRYSDEEDNESLSPTISDTKPDFTPVECFRLGCDINSPYNLVSLNGTLTCLEHEELLDPIVLSPETFKQDRTGIPLCHALKCRKSAKLRQVYGGLYCKAHLLEIQLGKVAIRTKPAKKEKHSELEFRET